MKLYNIILVFILVTFIGCKAQSIITKTNESKPDILIMLESKEIRINTDSLLNNDFKPINSRLQTSKSRSQIEQLLVGNWNGDLRTRINGQDEKEIVNSVFNFSSTFNFKEITEIDTLTGEYFIQKDSTSNLVLIYDKPQYPYPKEMLDQMTEEEKEQIAYQIRYMNIFEIDSENLLFYFVLPIMDYSNPGMITHSRLMIERYVKE
jgi:hypothetical protein